MIVDLERCVLEFGLNYSIHTKFTNKLREEIKKRCDKNFNLFVNNRKTFYWENYNTISCLKTF